MRVLYGSLESNTICCVKTLSGISRTMEMVHGFVESF